MKPFDLTAKAMTEVSENEDKLRNYVRLLKAANELARLTGPSDEETLWEKHVMDCAHVLPLIGERESVIDVGTGGGLPGILIAVCRPQSEVVLLDSITRKCALLEKIALAMGLRNAKVVCDRSESYAAKRRERFSISTARAVTSSAMLAELLTPLTKPGGKLLAFKGPRAPEELEPAKGRWGELGLSDPSLIPYSLQDMTRFIMVWEKKSPAPKGFPRRPGMAEKFPWYKMRKRGAR
jgi:16S rRNA (guanine527-N7)-methyltransferase